MGWDDKTPVPPGRVADRKWRNWAAAAVARGPVRVQFEFHNEDPHYPFGDYTIDVVKRNEARDIVRTFRHASRLSYIPDEPGGALEDSDHFRVFLAGNDEPFVSFPVIPSELDDKWGPEVKDAYNWAHAQALKHGRFHRTG
jgi:hypothetical protein